MISIYNGSRTTLLSRLQSTTTITSTPQTSFDGYNSTYFSSQSGFQFYGFNYTYGNFKVRWGFAWNNEGSQGSNDAWGGIGLYLSPYNHSAGDRWHWSGVTVRGANRSARVEIYVR